MLELMISSFRRQLPAGLTQPGALKARQYLIPEIRQLVEIVDEGNADATYPGRCQFYDLIGDMIWVADDGGCGGRDAGREHRPPLDLEGVQ